LGHYITGIVSAVASKIHMTLLIGQKTFRGPTPKVSAKGHNRSTSRSWTS